MSGLFGFLALAAIELACLATVIGAVVFAVRARDVEDRVFAAVFGGGALIVGLIVLAVATSGPSVPDGCYRIGSYSGTGVGVGVGSKGGVTVVPITTSGRTYTPIACPQ